MVKERRPWGRITGRGCDRPVLSSYISSARERNYPASPCWPNLGGIDALLSSLLTNLAATAIWEGGKRLLSVSREWQTKKGALEILSMVVSRAVGEQVSDELLRRFLNRPDLLELLGADPGEAASAFGQEAAALGLRLNSPSNALAAVLIAVASSDLDLAERVYRANTQQQLGEVSFKLEHMLVPLLAEIVAIRRTLDPTNDREHALSIQIAESDARVVQLFVALGVDDHQARRIAMHPAVGTDVTVQEGTVGLFAGVAGSGKTMTALRTYQVALVFAILDPSEPVPVYLEARTTGSSGLRQAIVLQCGVLGDPTRLGLRLVLDGLDEVDRDTAQRLISEAQVIASSWPRVSVAAFGRPDRTYPAVQAHPLPAPDAGELERVAAEIAGRERPFIGLHGPIRQAIELPLYAIAAAVLLRQRQDVPQSPAGILRALIHICMHADDVADEVPLRRLAVELTATGEAHEADFGTTEALRATRSRLVLLDDGALRFAVPLFQEWFASQALLLDGAVRYLHHGDAWAFDRWRYALALALVTGSSADVDRLAHEMLARAPAGFCLVLDEATSGPSHAVAREAPLGSDTRIVSAMVDTHGPFTAVVDLMGREATEASSTTVVVQRQWAHITMRNPAGTQVRGRSTLLNTAEPAWPWRLAADEVRESLGTVLDRRLLPIDDVVARAEITWALARLIADDRSLSHSPIDPGPVLDALAGWEALAPNEPVLIRGRRALWLPAGTLESAIGTLERTASTGGRLERPWPTPDNLGTRSGWVDDLYTPLAAAQLLRGIYESALQIYENMVARWFRTFAPYMEGFATLPVLLRVVFQPREDAGFGAIEWTSSHPLPEGETSRVEIAVAERDALRDFGAHVMAGHDIFGETRRRPPPFSWAYSYSQSFVRGLHSDRPALHQAYRWLEDDLRTLKWQVRLSRYDCPD